MVTAIIGAMVVGALIAIFSICLGYALGVDRKISDVVTEAVNSTKKEH